MEGLAAMGLPSRRRRNELDRRLRNELDDGGLFRRRDRPTSRQGVFGFGRENLSARASRFYDRADLLARSVLDVSPETLLENLRDV